MGSRKRISNGPMERVNRDIKLLYEVSFGSTNFERIRNRIMYCLNDNAPILGNRKDKTNKTIGKKRHPYKKITKISRYNSFVSAFIINIIYKICLL